LIISEISSSGGHPPKTSDNDLNIIIEPPIEVEIITICFSHLKANNPQITAVKISVVQVIAYKLNKKIK